jgi:lipopolysaccharide/colanic/teichoic acid biosynthesis glycosyltransferase
MLNQLKKIAVITREEAVSQQVKGALEDEYELYFFNNGQAFNESLKSKIVFSAIISADELNGSGGIPLHDYLTSLGHGLIPFIILMDQIDDEDRKLAMQDHIAEIFSKPLNAKAFRLRVTYLMENWTAKIPQPLIHPPYKIQQIKRIFDITFSGLALLLLSPIFGIIALLIRLESKGPVFYYSLRVGTGYKIFKFYKFRSMYTGADARLKDLSHLNQYNESKSCNEATSVVSAALCGFCRKTGSACQNPLYTDHRVVCEYLSSQQNENISSSAFIKIKNDPRITRVGNFIRNASLDELPQLWNVFTGDMSIVGNRPLPLYEAEKITTDKSALRFMAPAGITGLWQVEKRGREEMSEQERLNLDNDYAKNHSFVNDIKLIVRTFPALFQTGNV